jgi:hypothetical protein
VAVLSYDHDRYIALGADLRLVPDLDLMKGFVEAAFEELKLAAGKRPSSEAPVLIAPSFPVLFETERA